jgi:hypothetical protein
MDLKSTLIKKVVLPGLKGVETGSRAALEAPGTIGPRVIRAVEGPTAMQSVGNFLIGVAKTSRQKLLEGPDGLITKDPVMRARYLPNRGTRQGVNLRTIHDINLNSLKKIDLTKQVGRHI